MADSHSIQQFATALFFLAILAGLYVLSQVTARVSRDGGKVGTSDMELPELLMSIVLAGYAVMLVATAILHPPKEVAEAKMESVLSNALVYIAIASVILSFLQYIRRLPVARVFGLGQLHPLSALGWAVGLYAATMPLVFQLNFLMQAILKDTSTPQPLVTLFSHVTQQGDYASAAKIALSAAILAPMSEEILFRGFFYGVWKRYLGPVGAAIVASLLFAALHLNLTSFPSLFLLGMCLTLSYERTGSLLVPMIFHACFNSTSLVVLFLQARQPALPIPT